jgi:hypothetical protein
VPKKWGRGEGKGGGRGQKKGLAGEKLTTVGSRPLNARKQAVRAWLPIVQP